MGFGTTVLRRLGYEVRRVGGNLSPEEKAMDTGADAFASSLGGNFNENFSSFNNQKQQLQSYVEWVYAAASAIAEHCAAIDFRLFQNNTKTKNAAISQRMIDHPKMVRDMMKKKVSFATKNEKGELIYRKDVPALEELESHPLLDLLHAPNPYFVKNEFLETTFLHLVLTGDAFWAIFRDKKTGKPAELWTLMPDRVTVVPGKDEFIEGYTYQVDGANQVQFGPNDIIHHKLVNPTNFHRGYSPIMAGARTIDADSHASNWNREVMYNRATPSGIYKTDAKLDEKAWKRLKQEIMDTFGGSSNHGRPAVLEQGLDFKPISMTQKDMDFLNLRNFSRDQILSILGVPKSVLGLDESMSRANAETSEYVFSKRNRNKMQRLTNRITEDLAIQFGGNLVVSFTDPVPDDKEFLLKETEAALGGIPYASPNEERAKRGDDPIPGGDEPWVNSSMMPMSAVLDAVAAKKEALASAPAVNPNDEDEDVNQDDDDSADDGSGDDTDTNGNNQESNTNTDSSGDTSGSSSSESTNDSGNQAMFTPQQLKQLQETIRAVMEMDRKATPIHEEEEHAKFWLQIGKAEEVPSFPKPIENPEDKPEDDDEDKPTDPGTYPPTPPQDPVMGEEDRDEVESHDSNFDINDAMEVWVKNREKMTIGFENQMLRGATEHFLMQKHEVMSNLPVIMGEKGTTAQIVKASKKKMNQLFDKSASAVAWSAMLLPAYTNLGQKAGDSAVQLLNDPQKYGYAAEAPSTPFKFDPNTEPVKQYFEERAGYRTPTGTVTSIKDPVGQGIDAETDKQLRATLTEGLTNGESLQDLADRVENVYGAASGYRALRIARTESQAALHFASKMAWEQSKADIQSYIWLTASNPCPLCKKWQNVVRKSMNDFPNGGDYLHPNCRCDCVPFQINNVQALELAPEV